MKILLPIFSPPHPEWGGITRMLAFAEVAAARGHAITFCASGPVEELLKNFGWEVYTMPATTLLGLPGFLSKKIVKKMQTTTPKGKPGESMGSIWLLYVYTGMGRKKYLKKIISKGLNIIETFQPDIIFTDYDPVAYLLAKISKLPIATTFQGVYHDGVESFSWKHMNRNVNKVLKEYKIPKESIEQLFFGSSVLKIIPSIPELENIDETKPGYCFVGSLLGKIKNEKVSAYSPDPKKKHIFVYLGSTSIAINTVKTVMKNVAALNPDYTIVICSQSIEEETIQDNLVFTSYISAEKLLPVSEWTICHGGQNTIIQSLSHGVPLIIFPNINSERRFNSEKVKEMGAGLVGETMDFTSEWLCSILKKQDEFKNNAIELSKKIKRFNGAQQALDVIEKKLITK